jgi:uncharacterized membrane protein
MMEFLVYDITISVVLFTIGFYSFLIWLVIVILVSVAGFILKRLKKE